MVLCRGSEVGGEVATEWSHFVLQFVDGQHVGPSQLEQVSVGRLGSDAAIRATAAKIGLTGLSEYVPLVTVVESMMHGLSVWQLRVIYHALLWFSRLHGHTVRLEGLERRR